MADEFVDRYRSLSHEVLYARLQAGDPETIANAAAKWQSASTSIGQIRDGLSTDLAALVNGWSGSSSEEYQRRLGLVADYATTLSESQASVKDILGIWSTTLAEAQAKAEAPETVENEAGEAYTDGVSSFFAVSPALGDQLGHQQADEVIEAAHERMVQLVVDLAVEYESGAGRFPTAAEPDPDMPGADVPLSGAYIARFNSADDSASSAIYTAGSSTGSSSGSSTTTVSYSGDGSGTAVSNVGYTTGDGTTLTTLAGVDGDGVVTLATTGAVGAGGVIMSQASLSTTGITGTGSGLGLSLASTANTVPAGGLLASAKPTTSKAITPTISEGAPTQSTTTRTTGTNPTTNATNNNDDEDDEYTTWLTEDNMVWGDDDQDVPPAVLG